jgi:hypothetical protein
MDDETHPIIQSAFYLLVGALKMDILVTQILKISRTMDFLIPYALNNTKM